MNLRTLLILRKEAGRDALVATRPYRLGDVVFRLGPLALRPSADDETVRHPAGGHAFHPLLAKAAHSDDPNCRVSFPGRVVTALRPIASGERLTIDRSRPERRHS